MVPDQKEIVEFERKASIGQVNVDEAKGIVECFVAAIGNKDSVGDIIIPGAFDGSLKRRKPRVVWGHNWNDPIGKVLEIFEVRPNDSRMPAKMKQAGVGGLFARVQFNLKSEKGKEAFNNVVFFGEDQEWSIGYKTLNADFDPQRQANILKEVELYEVSPVLHGANQLTATISIKADNSDNLSVGDLVTWSSSGGTSYGKIVKKKTTGSLNAQPKGPTMEASADNPAFGVQVWKQSSDGEWSDSETVTVHRSGSLRKIQGLPKTKSAKQDDEVTSFGKSKWKMFDRQFAERIKQDHPEIWRAGGNIKGNDQYEILTKIAEQGGVAKTDDQIAALKLREAWVARHKGDFRLPGVIAQIKWLAVGSRGEDHMKNVVNEAIKRRSERKGDGYKPKPQTIEKIQAALEEKMSGPVSIDEVRDTELDFTFDDKKWKVSWAALGGDLVVFSEPEPISSEEKDIYSGSPEGQPSSFGRIQRGEDEEEIKGGYGKPAVVMLADDSPEIEDDGLPAEKMEVVLKYLGEAEDWDESSMKAASEIVENWANSLPGPMEGSIAGVAQSEGKAVYVLNVPNLDKLREMLSSAIDLGTKPNTLDPTAFVPTMRIDGPPSEGNIGKPVRLGRVVLNWGPQGPAGEMYKPHGSCGCGGKCGMKVDAGDIPGAEADSSISAELLRGRGPRRGNLERLLRYWRPIMKKPGGFRRCVAELIDHPELAPWKPLCAWLHHETTGKWPNEGKGSGKTRRALRRGKGYAEEYGIEFKGGDEYDDDSVDEEDFINAYKAMFKFAAMEPEFVKMIQDKGSWMAYDEDDNEIADKTWDKWVSTPYEDDEDGVVSEKGIDFKVGRSLSGKNLNRISRAVDLLNEVLAIQGGQQKSVANISLEPERVFEVKQLIDPISEFYGSIVEIDEDNGTNISIEISSSDEVSAIKTALSSIGLDGNLSTSALDSAVNGG